MSQELNGYDQFEEETYGEERQTVLSTQFKCPNCGNNFEYDPTIKMLKCPYCDAEKEINSESVTEQNLNSGFNVDDTYSDTIEVVRCENCGSIIDKKREDIAFSCPYCHKTNITKLNDIKGVKPTGVIPFETTKSDADKVFNTWLKKKFFAQSKAKRKRLKGEFKGIYIPCWTFDSNSYSVYEGRLGKRYTTTVGSGKNRHTVTRTKWFSISGTNETSFDDVQILASHDISDKEFMKTSEFDTNNARKFEDDYLAGFTAVHYDKDIKTAYGEAEQYFNEKIRHHILSGYNYDVVGYLNVRTAFSNAKYKYILLPFWLNTYQYNNKKYSSIVNGVTNKIWGKYPISGWKIAMCVLIPLGITAITLFVLQYLGII